MVRDFGACHLASAERPQTGPRWHLAGPACPLAGRGRYPNTPNCLEARTARLGDIPLSPYPFEDDFEDDINHEVDHGHQKDEDPPVHIEDLPLKHTPKKKAGEDNRNNGTGMIRHLVAP